MLLDRPPRPGERRISDLSPLSLTYIQNFGGAARNFSFIFHGDDGDDGLERGPGVLRVFPSERRCRASHRYAARRGFWVLLRMAENPAAVHRNNRAQGTS
jgi:hypothetical protein